MLFYVEYQNAVSDDFDKIYVEFKFTNLEEREKKIINFQNNVQILPIIFMIAMAICEYEFK